MYVYIYIYIYICYIYIHIHAYIYIYIYVERERYIYIYIYIYIQLPGKAPACCAWHATARKMEERHPHFLTTGQSSDTEGVEWSQSLKLKLCRSAPPVLLCSTGRGMAGGCQKDLEARRRQHHCHAFASCSTGSKGIVKNRIHCEIQLPGKAPACCAWHATAREMEERHPHFLTTGQSSDMEGVEWFQSLKLKLCRSAPPVLLCSTGLPVIPYKAWEGGWEKGLVFERSSTLDLALLDQDH